MSWLDESSSHYLLCLEVMIQSQMVHFCYCRLLDSLCINVILIFFHRIPHFIVKLFYSLLEHTKFYINNVSISKQDLVKRKKKTRSRTICIYFVLILLTRIKRIMTIYNTYRTCQLKIITKHGRIELGFFAANFSKLNCISPNPVE